MELRCRNASPGFVWLSKGGAIDGWAKMVRSIPEELRAREAEHQGPARESIPYGDAPVGQVMRLTVRLPYWRPPCAIGWNIYGAVAEGFFTYEDKQQQQRQEAQKPQ